MPKTNLQQAIRKNVVHPCTLSGCTKKRRGVGRYCKPHAAARNLHGDPRGRSLHPKTYGPQRAIVKAFLQEHCEHVGVKSATAFLADWLRDSCTDSSLPSATEFRRLFDAGVSPLSILVEAAAVYLYSRQHPNIVDDGLRLSFAIGHAVLRLAPRETKSTFKEGRAVSYLKPAPASNRRLIGERIRLTLVGLLANIEIGLEQRTEQQRAFERSLRSPFPTVAMRSAGADL